MRFIRFLRAASWAAGTRFRAAGGGPQKSNFSETFTLLSYGNSGPFESDAARVLGSWVPSGRFHGANVLCVLSTALPRASRLKSEGLPVTLENLRGCLYSLPAVGRS